MRGVVSLAAAVSVPVILQNGQSFPFRNLILFITFIVILVTLVFQGLTLPWLIRQVKPEDRFTVIPAQKQEMIIQKKIAHRSLLYLREKYGNNMVRNEHLDNLLDRLEIDLNFFQQDPEEIKSSDGNTLSNYQRIYLDLLDQQRKLLYEMNHREEFSEDVIRKYLSLIDIEEYKVRENLL